MNKLNAISLEFGIYEVILQCHNVLDSKSGNKNGWKHEEKQVKKHRTKRKRVRNPSPCRHQQVPWRKCRKQVYDPSGNVSKQNKPGNSRAILTKAALIFPLFNKETHAHERPL